MQTFAVIEENAFIGIITTDTAIEAEAQARANGRVTAIPLGDYVIDRDTQAHRHGRSLPRQLRDALGGRMVEISHKGRVWFAPGDGEGENGWLTDSEVAMALRLIDAQPA